MTDLILMKIFRTKQIENNQGVTLVSEGVEANYQDMLNYAVFCLIKFTEEKQMQMAQQQ
jgi:phage portal protein BeeE